MININKSFNKLVNKALTKFDGSKASDQESDFLLNLTEKFTEEEMNECLLCKCNYYEKFIAFSALKFIFDKRIPELYLTKYEKVCIIAQLAYSNKINRNIYQNYLF